MKTQLDSLTDIFTQNLPKRALLGFDSLIDEMQVLSAARELGRGAIPHVDHSLQRAAVLGAFPVPDVSAAVADCPA